MRFLIFIASLLAVPALAEVRYGLEPVEKPAEITYGVKPVPKRATELFMLGHLQTPALSTLPQNKWSVGTMALGYGITDRLTVATSPWLIGFYNLNNLVLRYRQPLGRYRFWGVQMGYFKDNSSLGKTYKMEAMGLWGLYRIRLTPSYRIVLSLNYFNFMDDTVPFSLRRWDLANVDNKGQWTFSTLNEIGITKLLRFFVETGVLAFNYSSPNYHFGTSAAYRWSDEGYIQLGLSATGYLSHATRSAYNQVFQQHGRDPNAVIDFPSVYENSVAIHPEIQMQWEF